MASRYPRSKKNCVTPGTNFNPFETVEKILTATDSIDLNAIYRGRYFWIQYETSYIVEKVDFMLKSMPAARFTALEILGSMIHENVHLYFLERERSKFARNYTKLDAAVKQILSALEQDSINCSQIFVADVLRWLIRLIIDLVVVNQRRLKVAYNTMGDHFRQFPVPGQLLKLSETLFEHLLTTNSDDVFPILLSFVDFERPPEDRQFEWLLTFYLNRFSNDVVLKFLRFGGAELRKAARKTSKPPTTDELAAVERSFLAANRQIFLLVMFIQNTRSVEMKYAIETILSDYLDGPESTDHFNLVFLTKAASASPLFLDATLITLVPKLKKDVILKLCNLAKDPYFSIANESSIPFSKCLIIASARASPNIAAGLLEDLQPIAFDPEIGEIITGLSSETLMLVQEVLKHVSNEFLNIIVRYIHETKNVSFSTFTTYQALETDDRKLLALVDQCIPNSSVAVERRRLLYCFCVATNNAFVRKVFGMYLIRAQTDEELRQFTVFSVPILLFYPTVMVETLKDLARRASFYKNLLGKDAAFHALKNMTTLNQWTKQHASTPDSMIRCLSLMPDRYYEAVSLMELTGSLISFAMMELLNVLEAAKTMNNELFECVVIVVSFVKSIEGVTSMEPGCCHAISRLFASVYVHCLRLVEAKDEIDHGSAAVLQLNSAIAHLFAQKYQFPKAFFISTLIQEVVLCSTEIFGMGKDFSNIEDPYTNGHIASSLLPPQCEGYRPEVSLLAKYREMVPKDGKARDLAHTGVLKKRGKPNHNGTQATSERVRLHHLMHTVDSFLAPDGESCDVGAMREVSLAFVDIICNEKNVSSLYFWDDWLDEKYPLYEFIAISNNLKTIPFAFDFMCFIASGPYPLFFTMAPLLKAQLAVLVNACEVTPLKTLPVPITVLNDIERFLTLVALAGIAPDLMNLTYEVISRCTNHEASAILFEVWRLLLQVRPRDSKIINDLISDYVNPKKTSPMMPMPMLPPLLTFLLMVCQRNPTKLVDLCPRIISMFPPEPEDDVWEVERLLPVMSVNEIMKR